MEKRFLKIDYRDFLSMLEGMESSDFCWCETCGAWLSHDDPACATTEDMKGCWKTVTGGNPRYEHLCRSERGALIDEARLHEKEAEAALLT